MKNVFAKGFIKFGLLAAIALISAGVPTKAQSLQYKLTVNIPFDFTVLDQKLPAGKYSIGRAQLGNGDLVVQINSLQKNETVTRITIPVVTRDPGKDAILVFRQYGDEYFLSEIWPAGGHTGRALPRSRTERELERQGQDVKVAKVRLQN